jgi:hypothetical protein
VLELELDHCPNCGGEMKIIAAILEQPIIEKILTLLGLQARTSNSFAATNSGQSMSLIGRRRVLTTLIASTGTCRSRRIAVLRTPASTGSCPSIDRCTR